MNDAVGGGRSPLQALEILERTALDLAAGSRNRPGRCIGAGQAEHPMASADELPNGG